MNENGATVGYTSDLAEGCGFVASGLETRFFCRSIDQERQIKGTAVFERRVPRHQWVSFWVVAT